MRPDPACLRLFCCVPHCEWVAGRLTGSLSFFVWLSLWRIMPQRISITTLCSVCGELKAELKVCACGGRTKLALVMRSCWHIARQTYVMCYISTYVSTCIFMRETAMFGYLLEPNELICWSPVLFLLFNLLFVRYHCKYIWFWCSVAYPAAIFVNFRAKLLSFHYTIINYCI